MELTHARPAPLRAAHEVAPDLSRKDAFASLARPGLIARGVVYGVIGVLAIKVAVGSAGTAPNQQGALQAIARQPYYFVDGSLRFALRIFNGIEIRLRDHEAERRDVVWEDRTKPLLDGPRSDDDARAASQLFRVYYLRPGRK